MVADEAVPTLPRGVRLRQDPQRGWLLLAPERIFTPDPVAVEVLRRCDGKRTVAEVVDDLASTFAAERARIDADVKALLTDLSSKRILDLGGPP